MDMKFWVQRARVFFGRRAIWAASGFVAGTLILPLLGYVNGKDALHLQYVDTKNSLRTQKMEAYERMIALSNEYSQFVGTQPPLAPNAKKQELWKLNASLKLYMESFKSAETALAELEGRNPVFPKLAFLPPGEPGTPVYHSGVRG